MSDDRLLEFLRKNKFHQTTLQPQGICLMVNALWHKMQHLEFNAFGGELDAGTIVGGLSYLMGLSPFNTRFHAFTTHFQNAIGVQPDDRCVLIAPHTEMFTLLQDSLHAIEKEDAKVVKVFSVLDHEKDVAEKLAEKDIEFEALVKGSQL